MLPLRQSCLTLCYICRLRVLAAQAYPLASVILITAACAVYEKAIRKSDWPSLDNLQASAAYSLCSFALSLLLIFKTNSSYSRFWEARIAWGLVCATTPHIPVAAVARFQLAVASYPSVCSAPPYRPHTAAKPFTAADCAGVHMLPLVHWKGPSVRTRAADAQAQVHPAVDHCAAICHAHPPD